MGSLHDAESHSLIELAPEGCRRLAGPAEMDAARTTFERDHCVRLAGLLSERLLSSLPQPIESASFVPNAHKGLKTELCMEENASLALLMFCTNDPAVLTFVQELTGVAVDSFTGRVYRMVPGKGHHDGWHDDLHAGRVLALSVNVGAEPYDGGHLLLRERTTGQQILDASNLGMGDGLLFRLDTFLEHRVDDVRGSVPKTAYAGWFVSGKTFTQLVRSLSEA